MDYVIGALGLLFLLGLVLLVVWVFVLGPIVGLLRWAIWRVRFGGHHEPAPPALAGSPGFLAWLSEASPGAGQHHASRVAVGGPRSELAVIDTDGDGLRVADLVRGTVVTTLRPLRSCGLGPVVSADGRLVADRWGIDCRWLVLYRLPDGTPYAADVRLGDSRAVDDWCRDPAAAAGPATVELEVLDLVVRADGDEVEVVMAASLLEYAEDAPFEAAPRAALLVRVLRLRPDDLDDADDLDGLDDPDRSAAVVAEHLHPLGPEDDPPHVSVRLSPNGRLLAVGRLDAGPDAGLTVLNTATGTVRARLTGAGSPLAWSGDSRRLAATSMRRELREGLIHSVRSVLVWTVESAGPIGMTVAVGRWDLEASVECAAFLDDGQRLALGVEEAVERTWAPTWRTPPGKGIEYRRTVRVCALDGAVLTELPVAARLLAAAVGDRLVVSGPAGVSLWSPADAAPIGAGGGVGRPGNPPAR